MGLKDGLLGASSRPLPRFVLGAGFVLVGAGGCGVLGWSLIRALAPLPWAVRAVLLAVLLKPLFSISALLDAGKTVQGALEQHDRTVTRSSSTSV